MHKLHIAIFFFFKNTIADFFTAVSPKFKLKIKKNHLQVHKTGLDGQQKILKLNADSKNVNFITTICKQNKL